MHIGWRVPEKPELGVEAVPVLEIGIDGMGHEQRRIGDAGKRTFEARFEPISAADSGALTFSAVARALAWAKAKVGSSQVVKAVSW